MAKRPKLDILDEADVKRIVEAAYDLLETFGVMVDNEEALGVLADGGAKVDMKEKMAHIDPGMVDRALETRPTGFTIHDQTGQSPGRLEGDRAHFCPGSVALNILDSDTETIRKPKLTDLVRITSLAHTLENVDFITGSLVPDDIPGSLSDAYRYYLLMLNTSKPMFTGGFTVGGVRVQLEMLEVLCGGREAFKEKPRAVFAANPTAPLRWGGVVAQNLVDCAKASAPVMLIPMPLPGGNAPVTLAGTLAEHTAENLSGLVMAQLLNPGTPVLYGGGAIVLDMRLTSSCIGATESHLLGCGYSQIGKYLGFPTASNIGQSDAKRVDAQAGLESGQGIMLAAQAGINLSRGPGMMAHANCQSPEKLVVDNNICGNAKRLIKGIETSPETIALDEIKAAGREARGYLSSNHTVEWFRDQLFFPTSVIHREYADEGRQVERTWDRAKAEVKQRLDEYQPFRLEPEKTKEIMAIMKRYAKKNGVDQLPEVPGPWVG